MSTQAKQVQQVLNVGIPVGLSSKVGFLVSAALGVVSGVEAVANGDHTTAAISTLAGAVLLLFQTLGGRFAQAAALLRDVPPPPTIAIPSSPTTKGVL